MNSQKDKQIRQQLVKHINGGEAFMTIDAMLEKVSFEHIHIVPKGLPYSFYQVFYHIRLAQHDIFEFSRDPDYDSPKWPEEYWPKKTGPVDDKEWNELVAQYLDERKQFCELLLDPAIDLLKPFPHGSGQNLSREALLVIEHTSYHTGQLMTILRLTGKHN